MVVVTTPENVTSVLEAIRWANSNTQNLFGPGIVFMLTVVATLLFHRFGTAVALSLSLSLMVFTSTVFYQLGIVTENLSNVAIILLGIVVAFWLNWERST